MYWDAHNQLRAICETHENTILDHPFQWETLADFTHDDKERLSAYKKAIKLAQHQNQFEYIASIGKELSEIYLGKNNNTQALVYYKLSKDALAHIDDPDLTRELEEIAQMLF